MMTSCIENGMDSVYHGKLHSFASLVHLLWSALFLLVVKYVDLEKVVSHSVAVAVKKDRT